MQIIILFIPYITENDNIQVIKFKKTKSFKFSMMLLAKHLE